MQSVTGRGSAGRRSDLAVAIASIIVSVIALVFALYVPDRIDQAALQRQRVDGCLEALISLREAMTSVDVAELSTGEDVGQVAAWVKGQAAIEDARLRCRGLLGRELDDRGGRLWTLYAGALEDVRREPLVGSPHPGAIHDWAGDALLDLSSINEPAPWWAPWRW